MIGVALGAIALLGLLAELLTEGWRAPSADLYSDAAMTAPVFALALFLEIAVVMAPVIAEQGLTSGNQATVQTLVRLNASMLAMSETASLYATGARRETAFLTILSLGPWVIQLALLVDTAYLKVGLSRVGRYH